MKLKQVSIFLENRPGTLSPPLRLLGRAKINVVTLSIAESNEFGILRLMVREWEKVKALLEKEGFVVKVTDVVAVEVVDRPGGLADILDVVEKQGVNIEYMYAFSEPRMNRGLLIFRFDKPDEAIRALQGNKIKVVESVDWLEQAK